MKLKRVTGIIFAIFLVVTLPAIPGLEYTTANQQQENHFLEYLENLSYEEFKKFVLQYSATDAEFQKMITNEENTLQIFFSVFKWIIITLLKLLSLPLKITLKFILKILVLPIKLFLFPLKILLLPLKLVFFPVKIFLKLLLLPVKLFLKILLFPVKLVFINRISSILNPFKNPLKD